MPEPLASVISPGLAVPAEYNPIVPGFFPDPTICRVGDDYYLAHSSFEYFPGAPLFHSRDLTSWTQIGNILTRRSQFRAGTSGPSTGIYGSTLRHRDGRFWFITTNVSDFDAGQVLVSAMDPTGPWSEPVFIPQAIGIDPDLSWDEDGTCYLTWHVLDFTVGGQGIRQAPIDLGTGRLLEPEYPVWQGSGMPIAEGPHLYRIGEHWYLMLAEGGTERGHSVTIARGPSPRGPFESCPWNPVFTHRSSDHPVQNVGHADLVEGPDGEWAAVYLGARPRGSTPGFHVLGRETFLSGVEFVDGWPVFNERRYVIPTPSTGFLDDFTAERLDPRWVVADGEPDTILDIASGDGARFRTWGTPSSFLCTRVRDFVWTADAEIEHAGSIGLRLDDRHWCGLIAENGGARAVVQVGDFRSTLANVDLSGRRSTLRISAVAPKGKPLPFGYAGPDDVVLSVGEGRDFTEVARFDGRYFSTEVAAGFTGRMLTLGSPSSEGRVLSFRYAPTSD